MTYCTECGNKLIRTGDAIRFSRKTGEPIYKMECPTPGCKNQHKSHTFEDITDQAVGKIVKGGNIIEFGIPYLDDPAGGMTRGEITTIGGRPSHGKTTMMLNIIDSLAQKGLKIMLFNREMTNESAIQKLLVMNSDFLTYDHMRKRVMADGAVAEVRILSKKIKEKYANLRMYDDLRDLNSCIAEIKKHEPDVFIDDYIQMIKLPGPKQDRRFDIEDIMNEYKWVAKKTNSSGILISQLSREVEKRLDHTPMMGDYAEGATIEHASENCVFIQYPHLFDPVRYERDQAEIIFRKVRYGRIGSYKIKFQGEKCRFLN